MPNQPKRYGMKRRRSKRRLEFPVRRHYKKSFSQWKKEAIAYLHKKAKTKNYDWMLGDDEDMLPIYNDGESAAEYVDYQIECAA